MQPFDQEHEAEILQFPTPQHPSWAHEDDWDMWVEPDLSPVAQTIQRLSVWSFLTDLVLALSILGLFFVLLWTGTALVG